MLLLTGSAPPQARLPVGLVGEGEMREQDPLPWEDQFFAGIEALVPDVQDWYNADADGRPWVCVSYDVVRGNSIWRTLRVDWDGEMLLGGDSPACLNWDDGVRARAAGIDTRPPHGLELAVSSVDEAVAAAAAWFRRRLA
jgi:hypothetical protein